MISLYVPHCRALGLGDLEDYKSPLEMRGARRLARDLCSQLDVVGILFVIAIFSFILVPLTIAGDSSELSEQ